MTTHSEYPSLSYRQVAKRLAISETSLFRLLQKGKGPPSYKIGGSRRWKESDVLDWLESECRQAGTSEAHHAAALAR